MQARAKLSVMVGRALAVVLGLASSSVARADDAKPAPWLVSAEVDPFPFATRGYGMQIGVRPPALGGIRIALASFLVNVPEPVAELNGNDGFDVTVRPSAALYVLRYFAPPGRDGLAVGGALRYLRFWYRHDDVPGAEAFTSELSPEAIVAYQWHPFGGGFYLQPWAGLSFTAVRSGERVVGGKTYDPLVVQPFFTVNIGWEEPH